MSIKKKALGLSFIGTQRDLTSCTGRQWHEPLPACSFAAPNYCSSRRLNTSVNSATVSIIPMTMK